MEDDLYAARINKPPEVKKANLIKDKNIKKVYKTTKPQKIIKIKNVQISEDINIIEDSPILEDQSLLTQPFAPKPSFQQLEDSNNNLTKKPRDNIPITSKITYKIEDDILNRKADINVKDLIIAVPALKRNLVKAIRDTTKNPASSSESLSLTFAEDDDVDTTAIYTDFFISGVKIKAMLDTGSAKTCMSKDIADKLGLEIDAASTSVFTLGNGTKQASLGLIYDVPLNIGGNIVIPGAI